MNTLRIATLATCLALAATPALAQVTNRSWRGDALRYTPSSVAGCDVSIMEAATSQGHVVVTLRQGGTGQVNFTVSGELAGNGHRSIGTYTTRLTPGRNTRVTLMRVYEGSLANSVLTLHGSACSVIN